MIQGIIHYCLIFRHILDNVYTISLHKKTAVAINNKKNSIEKELLTLRRIINGANSMSTRECQKLLDKTRCILDINGSYCCRCNKPLDKMDVKECNGCHRMTYCSRACQKEDWLNGHKLTCCKSFTDEIAGQFQGRIFPSTAPANERAASKLKDLEVNSNMVQLKLFLDNAQTIMSQAKAMGVPLSDCLVIFSNLNELPLVETKKIDDYYQTPEEKKGFEASRYEKNITCLYYLYLSDGHLGKNGDPEQLVMQRLYPYEWLLKQVAIKMQPHEVISLFGKSSPPTKASPSSKFVPSMSGIAPPQAQAPFASFALGGSTDSTVSIGNTFSLGTSATSGASSRRRAAKKSTRRK